MQVEIAFDEEGRYRIAPEGAAVAPADAVPDPVVLFLGSIGACAGAYAVRYLQARDLPFAGLRVLAESSYADGPRHLGDIRVRVVLPAPLEERHLAPPRRSIDLCTLKNSPTHPPAVPTELTHRTAA
jgi:ribosomal protein S12 methylthiotransferase accessory factor